MKIIKKVINFRKKVFAVRMNLDQGSDDVWNIYNLLSINDYVTGTCHRKVKKEGTGMTKIENKTFTCTLQVKSFQYDAENDSLRINGLNATENRNIALQQQQSMDVTPPRQIMIVKKVFDSMHVRRLNQMVQEQDVGNVVAITMEEGIAHVFVISQAKTLLKQKIEKSITKSRGAASAMKNSQQKSKFYDQIIQALQKNFMKENQTLDSKIGAIVCGSPGFTRENFFNYLKDQAERRQSAFLREAVNKVILCHCSTGYKHSLKEILSNAAVNQQMLNMSCAQETQVLDNFFTTLAVCEDKVTYGPKSVEKALHEMAVSTLLISDKLFRAKDVEKRKYYVQMHDRAVRTGIQVVVFGSLSAAGQRLNNLTGIAAVLHFEMPQLQDLVDEDEGDLDSEEDEGEIGGSSQADNSDAGSAHGGSNQGAAQRPPALGSAQSSESRETGGAVGEFRDTLDVLGEGIEESKSMHDSQSDAGSYWDQNYLNDVFGAAEDIDYGDELPLDVDAEESKEQL